MEHRAARAADCSTTSSQIPQRAAVVALPQRDEPEVEARLRLWAAARRTRRNSRIASSYIAGLVEGDPQVAVLVDARLAAPARGRRCAPHAVGEAGLDQPEERLADLELHQPGVVDDLLHAALAVDERQDLALLAR